jgi:hypothetical protein
VAAVTSQLTLLLILVSRELRTRVRFFLVACTPAAVTAAGVAIGAGAVRLVWPDLSLGPLVAGSAAGCAGGLAALRLFAGSTYADVRDLVRARTSAGEPA